MSTRDCPIEAVPDEDGGAKRAAKKLIADFENLWAERYRHEPANLAVFSRDWMQWYDHVTDELAASGFRKVGDIAAAPLHRDAVVRPNISRKFLSADGTVRADVYQWKNAKRSGPVRVCMMKTELDDAAFLSTHNSAHKWNTPDSICAERLPPDATPASIASVHQRRLTDYLLAHRVRVPRVLTSLADVLDSEARERTLIADFRRRQDLPAIEELLRLGAKPAFAERIHAEMRRIRSAAAAQKCT